MAIRAYYQQHKRLVTLLAIGLGVLLTVGMVMRARSGEVKYLTAKVQRGDITAVVQATGTINPLTTVPVGSYVSGTVQYVFADFNSRVRAGQVLAQLDPAIYEAQVIQARGNLANAEANVKNLEASLAGMQAAIETNLRYTTILSPIDGTIVARNVTVGQSVAASLQAPVVFTIAQDLTRMQVYAATDESDTGNVRIGAEVTFQVDAFPTATFQGRVSAIRLNATTVQNVVTYSTVIDFENPEEKLLPGETAYITIPTGHAVNVIKVP